MKGDKTVSRSLLVSIEKQNDRLLVKEDNQRLWAAYATKNKPYQLRDQLIKKYAYLVNWVVGRFPYIETADFDREDLIGYGTIGLIESIDRFDPKQKCSFETFAVTRIRGEILDFLRSRDFLSRSRRQRVKKLNEAIVELEYKLGRTPTDDEIKTTLGIEAAELQDIRQEAAAMIFSLDIPEDGKSLEDSSALVDKVPSNEVLQDDLVDNNFLKEKLAQCLDRLPKRERLIMALYHYQKLTFKEIGAVLDISESRVSQLHMKSLQKLRVMLKDYEF